LGTSIITSATKLASLLRVDHLAMYKLVDYCLVAIAVHAVKSLPFKGLDVLFHIITLHLLL